ncbi:MAG: DNA polymerase I [Gracilimonas sp.]|uniref:DNA polymerase I n=1 Tax=Gracilimonas sp. TaxID=1974203 RepID=UPI00199146C8|nr:DNA polymerase I [Gracilimonas sp.]MBD3615953.1 DNA polymerase I [Gracilimonas sp.]
MSKKLLYLLDGMALAYRAHFAFINSRLKNSEGIPTGPVLGFANTLEKMLEEKKPTHIAVAWDTHAPTFRHEKDEDYKANRPPQPEELKIGIPLIKEMVKAWGIQNLEEDGYEADDIIGTIASGANADDVDVMMVTPDKDFMQLVHDHIRMMKPDNNNGGFNIIDREGVKDYFGVYPEDVIDVLAIIGDTSDNIPGVPGIGKKGAPKLIKKYGSLEAAIEDAPNIKGKRAREGLMEYGEQALHAKDMVTIKTDVPNTKDWEELGWEGPDKKKLGLFFKRMEFRTLTKRYLGEEGPVASKDGDQVDLFGSFKKEAPKQELDKEKVNYALLDTIEKVKGLVDEYKDEDHFCFDTETDSPDPVAASLVGISITATPGTAYYIPVNVEEGLDEKEVIEALRPLFEDSHILKIAHNFKFDFLILKRAGLVVKGNAFDTMIAAYLIDANQRLKMDELSKSLLNYKPVAIEELIGKGKKQKSMADLKVEDVYLYACEDADITLRLYEILNKRLKDDELLEIAYKVDFPLMEVLAEMELNGIKLDTEMLTEFSKELETDLKKLEEEIYEKAGEEFNINSPQQLGTILFEKLELPAGKKTKTGQYSTAESVLTKLAPKYEMPSLILEYRQLAKLKSTYVDAIPELVNEETGRVHTEFNQSVAATGRLASSNPNLQNIPIRTERGREMRKAFVAEEGFKLMSADYSQVELRVIAHIAKDKAMIEAFKNGEDIHARTAKEIFDLDSLEDVNADHRRKAKEVNFGIPYGLSAYGLAQNLGIENEEGKQMIDHYFERFPNILNYINETKEFAREHGYVKTMLGRRRYVPDIKSGNWNVRGFAERVAINMPIQGTAADIIKLAMIEIYHWLKENEKKSRMLLQVHDELIFEIHESEMDEVPDQIIKLMESAVELDVPLKVEAGIAENWLEAH